MATSTTLTSAYAWRPDQGAFNPSEAVPEALILQHSNVAGIIDGDKPALHVAFVNDAAAQFTAEGNTIPEANPTLDEALVYTAKVSQLVRISREQYHQTGTAQELSTSVQRAITNKANQAFLTQVAPTAPAVAPPTGLMNLAGTATGGAVDGNLDALIDLVATLEANGGTPTGIIIDPLGWAALRKMKTATGSEVGILGAGVTDAQKILLDLPVTVSNALGANTGLVIDRTAIASAVGPLQIATDESAYFTSDSVAVRATWRIGWNLVRANRIGKFTVAVDSE